MIGDVALCADVESLKHPEIMGLGDVKLDALPWLHSFSEGADLRAVLAQGGAFDEVWIVSVGEISALNLVAALRRDGFTGVVCMVVDDASGSVLSRAAAAGVSDVHTSERFVQRFSVEATRRRRMAEVARGLEVPGITAKQPIRNAPTKAGNPRSGVVPGPVRAPRAVPASGNGRLIAVMGASGGVGKSTVAAGFAIAAAAKGAKTLVLDGDLQFGCMHRMFDVRKPVTFDDAAADGQALERLAANVREGVPAVLAAPARMEHSEALNARVAEIAAAATGLFDIVVADTGASWSDAHASLMEMATCTLFVIDQRVESIRACQHALELCRRMGLATGSFTFALNRCSKEASFTSADVSCAMEGVHIHELADGGLEIEELCGGGMALSLANSGNAFAKSLGKLACEVMPEVFGEGSSSPSKEPGGAFFRLFENRRERPKRRQRKSNEIVVQAGPPHPAYRNAKHAWESL